MPSSINPANPTASNPTTSSVRENFLAAKNEIEDLQQSIRHTLTPFFLKTINFETYSFNPLVVGASALSVSACTTDKLWISPFVLSGDYILDEAETFNSTSSAAPQYIGVYANDVSLGYNMPGILLTDFPAKDSVPTGQKIHNCTPITLEKGVIYWMAFAMDSTSLVAQAPTASLRASLGVNLTNNVVLSHLYAVQAGPLPQNLLGTPLTPTSGNIPVVAFPIKATV